MTQRSEPWAKSILASCNANTGKRLDTLLVRMPRIILAEFNTHRVFSRNAASSRAIPIEKMIEQVMTDPFIPLHWGAAQKGMQAFSECNELVRIDGLPHDRERAWLIHRNRAVEVARAFAAAGYAKQLVNRLLEPWMWTIVCVSATETSNFFALRDHPDAEPHMQMVARATREAMREADVHVLDPGDWHLPFVTTKQRREAARHPHGPIVLQKISAACCASTSYKTVDGFEMSEHRAEALYDKLIGSVPLHASPFEHVAQADELYPGAILNWAHPWQHGNFTGFKQLRKMLPNECL